MARNSQRLRESETTPRRYSRFLCSPRVSRGARSSGVVVLVPGVKAEVSKMRPRWLAAERRQSVAPGASPGFSFGTISAPIRGERVFRNLSPLRGSVPKNDIYPGLAPAATLCRRSAAESLFEEGISTSVVVTGGSRRRYQFRLDLLRVRLGNPAFLEQPVNALSDF